MKRLKIIIVICLWVAILAGCQSKNKHNNHIVSHITVIEENSGSRREYSSQNTMRIILGMLRLMGDKGRADIDPQTLSGQGYRIIMTHTDGSSHMVCTRENRFIRDGQGPWQQVQPERLTRLHQVLENLPVDSGHTISSYHLPQYIPNTILTHLPAVFHSFGHEESLT